MRRSLLLVFAVITICVLGVAGWWLLGLLSVPATKADAAPPAQRVQIIHGETVVQVAPQVQRTSEIQVRRLHAIRMQAERTAYATVIDLQPLFALSNQLANAQGALKSAQAEARTAQAQLERMQVLFKDDRNVSEKNLQEARAAAESSQAKHKAAERVIDSINAEARQQFGAVLADAVRHPEQRMLPQLAHRQASVLRVTLPAGTAVDLPDRISVSLPDGQSFTARKLSVAPQADPALQGISYFYLAAAALPAGVRTTAQLPERDNTIQGVQIPESAIVWYGDERWAYVQMNADHFARRLVTPVSATGDGAVVAQGFHAGDAVVTRGAQLLLSEEQKPQGIATQCKDPPECDD